ncbi:MAG: hypothetical protein ACLFMX_06320 [Halobacteriales archaeon]
MDPAVRAGAALVNEGHRPVGRYLLARAGVADRLLEGLDDPTAAAVTVDRLRVRRTDDGAVRVAVDGVEPHLDDLDAAALVAGVRLVASDRGDLDGADLDRLARQLETAGEGPAATRLHLLLEDYLVRPTLRPVVADRLGRRADQERRRDRDVDALFDA